MTSLTDLFNPTFFILLAIILLVAGIVVFYFENQLRAQNHKIVSMFSIISTLAEDLNNVKSGLNTLILTGGNSNNSNNATIFQETLGKGNGMNLGLIEVSDDEQSEPDSDSDSDSERESESLTDNERESDYENEENSELNNEIIHEISDKNYVNTTENQNNIKILKLNIHDENDMNDKDIDNFDFNDDLNDDLNDLNDLNELNELNELNDFSEDELPDITNDYAEEILSLQYNVNKQNDENKQKEGTFLEKNENTTFAPNELKTISINLGEETHTEYKKLSLQKLRTLVVEKGLTIDSSKLKKNDLLKMLGIE